MRVRLGGHRVDVARRRELEDEVARLDRARAVVLHGAVGRAARDGRAGGQARRGRGLRRDAAREVRGLEQARELAGTEPGQLRELGVPVLPRHVEEERALRLDAVGGRLAREEEAHVVLHEEDVLRAGEDVRLVRLEPHQLRQRPGRRGHLVAAREDALGGAAPAQRLALGGRALVGPHDRAAHRLPVRVEEDGVVRGAVERERGDAREVDALAGELRERRAERLPPVRRVLLAPAGMLVVRRVFDRRLAGERAVLGADRRDLAPAGSEVHPQQQVHFLVQACAGSKDETSPRPWAPAMVQR